MMINQKHYFLFYCVLFFLSLSSHSGQAEEEKCDWSGSSCFGVVWKTVKKSDIINIDANARSHTGDTPLHVAARYSANPNIIDILIKMGADIDARNNRGFSPLHIAAFFNSNPEIIKTLFKFMGENENDDAISPLHQAALRNNAEIVQLLITLEGNIEGRNKEGDTPLHRAAFFNEDTKVIAALVNAGAEINIKNNDGNTPLHRAASRNKNQKIINSLINSGGNVNLTNNDGNTPLHLAARSNRNVEIIKALIQGENSNNHDDFLSSLDKEDFLEGENYTPYKEEYEEYYEESRYQIIDNEEEKEDIFAVQSTIVNLSNQSGNTPLHLAAQKNRSTDVITALLRAGGDITMENNVGNVALHLAAKKNTNHEVIQRLINAEDSDINKQNKNGDTPLILATKFNRTSQIVITLIELGADLEIKNNEGKRAIDYAKTNKKIKNSRAYQMLEQHMKKNTE